jgi:hypothetical protein
VLLHQPGAIDPCPTGGVAASVLQKSTATTPTPAEHGTHQLRREGAQRHQTSTQPRVCKQEVRGSIPRVSTHVRGPFRSTGRASFTPVLQQTTATGFTGPLSELVAEALERLRGSPETPAARDMRPAGRAARVRGPTAWDHVNRLPTRVSSGQCARRLAHGAVTSPVHDGGPDEQRAC